MPADFIMVATIRNQIPKSAMGAAIGLNMPGVYPNAKKSGYICSCINTVPYNSGLSGYKDLGRKNQRDVSNIAPLNL